MSFDWVLRLGRLATYLSGRRRRVVGLGQKSPVLGLFLERSNWPIDSCVAAIFLGPWRSDPQNWQPRQSIFFCERK